MQQVFAQFETEMLCPLLCGSITLIFALLLPCKYQLLILFLLTRRLLRLTVYSFTVDYVLAVHFNQSGIKSLCPFCRIKFTIIEVRK